MRLWDLTLGRLFKGQPKNQAISSSWELLEHLSGGWMTKAGVEITPSNATTIVALASAVSLLSEMVAMLPLPVYRRLEGGGKERNPDHPVWPLFNVAANDWQNYFEWREMMQAHSMLWGKALSVKVMSGNTIARLHPIHPTRFEPKMDERYRVTFDVRTPNGGVITLQRNQVFYLRDRSLGSDMIKPDGRVGLAKDALGLAKGAENFGAAFFGNNGQVSGVLSTEQKLTKEQMDQLRESWKASQAGDKAFNIAVLDGGFKFSPITALLKDSQFLESRKHQIAEVARIWRIPPHMLGDLEKATFSNIEHQRLEFVTDCLLPVLRRWEAAINTQLIAPERQSPHFAEFLVEGLLRGDTKTRMEFYSAGLRDGWLNRNEVREMENRNPIPGGDEYRQAESIFGAGETGAENEPGQTPPAG